MACAVFAQLSFSVLILTTKSNTDYAKFVWGLLLSSQNMLAFFVVKRKSFNLARWKMSILLKALRVDGCEGTRLSN